MLVSLLDEEGVVGGTRGARNFTNNPARVAAVWRRGSSGSLDSVFFHFVTWPLRRVEGFSRRSMPVPVDIRSVSLGQEVESSGGMNVPLTYGYMVERRPRERWELMRPIVCVGRPPASILRRLLVGVGG